MKGPKSELQHMGDLHFYYKYLTLVKWIHYISQLSLHAIKMIELFSIVSIVKNFVLISIEVFYFFHTYHAMNS